MEKRLGVYIHIPFCASKCKYCDFYSKANCDKQMPKYHNALLTHIRESASTLQNYFTDTVYFGGGTPSYYGARRLCEIFSELKYSGLVYKNAEVTVEVNPDSITKRDMKLLLSEGFNRISIGAQSANDDILKVIGRRHSWRQVEQTVRNAKEAGFRNISIDLIYGLPGQTKTDWADTLNKALALRVQHVSCYGLKIEEGTPLYEYKDSPFLPDEDEQADMYLYTVETMLRYGFNHYEISNFAKPGFESKHNLKYWMLRDYMGFGPGAHSCVDRVRYSFVRSLDKYISGIKNEDSIIDEYSKIEHIELAAEYIMLGMRTSRGISRKEYQNHFRSNFDPIEELMKEFEYKGWTKFEDERWRFTATGFLLSNLLIGLILEKQAQHRASAAPWMDTMNLFDEETELPEGDEVFYHSKA